MLTAAVTQPGFFDCHLKFERAGFFLALKSVLSSSDGFPARLAQECGPLNCFLKNYICTTIVFVRVLLSLVLLC